jgi:hypothetical protein
MKACGNVMRCGYFNDYNLNESNKPERGDIISLYDSAGYEADRWRSWQKYSLFWRANKRMAIISEEND